MLKKKQEVLFVDVRDMEAFRRFRISGSIHIPLHALKTKIFLKDKLLVLVSEGYPNVALEDACDGARAAGFSKTFILKGGLCSWAQKRGPIEGDSSVVHEASRVSPKEYFVHKDSGQWSVITISSPGVEPSQSLIPGAVNLRWDGDPRKFTSSLKALINSQPVSPQRSILVCDERGDKYRGIERAIRQDETGTIFYLRGGLEAYRAFLQQQALLGQPGREEVKRCVNCR